MRYYLVAGEASGDLHGSNLMKALKLRDPDAEFRFWGGDLMQSEGGYLVSHYRDRAYMGLWEVLTHLGTIRKHLNHCIRDILDWKPDRLVFIDNPGFNLRVAKAVHGKGIPVHYYIAPKVWAWNKSRVKQIRKSVDHLYSILPFEPDWFASYGIQAEYVGNPVVDAVDAFIKAADRKNINDISKPVIAMLPGSRRNEIERILPVFLRLIPKYPDYQFVLAAAPDFDTDWYRRFEGIESVKIVKGQTYQVLSQSHAALVASGTATLETALFGVPQVVCYKVAPATYFIGRMVVKLRWFGLVNLIMDRGVLAELLQGGFTPESAAAELEKMLSGAGRDRVLKDYEELRRVLGPSGASARTAEQIAH